ncbi:MAG: HupE/UreJ family protein [Gammaproteobacteria bacterium]
MQAVIRWGAIAASAMPGLALAHAGGAQAGGVQSASFLASIIHPFTSLDHIVVAALLVLVTLRRHNTIPWLPGALFISGVALGFLTVMVGARFEFAEYLYYTLIVLLMISFFRPRRVIPSLCLTVVALLGLSQGHAHGLTTELIDPTQCLCGIGLALGTLGVAALLALPVRHIYKRLPILQAQPTA